MLEVSEERGTHDPQLIADPIMRNLTCEHSRRNSTVERGSAEFQQGAHFFGR